MGWWSADEIVSVPEVLYERFILMAKEVYYLNYDEKIDGLEAKQEAESLIRNVLNEYVRQHFEESTKAAVQMAIGRQPKYRLP